MASSLFRIEDRQELEKDQGKKLGLLVSGGCLVLLFAICFFVGVVYFISKSEEIPVGSEVKLYSSSGKIGLSVDLDAFNEYRHALGADNQTAIKRLILSGRVLLVDSSTKAQTMSDGPTLYKVRILEGRYAGETGYLEDSQIIYKK